MGATMIDKYGRGRIRKAVVDFYAQVLRSPRLASYFDGIDIETLVAHQSAFLNAVMGDPASHSEQEIRQSHAHLGISNEDFDEMIELLGNSLDRAGIEEEDRLSVQTRYRSFAGQVVTAGR
jgi:hemoglobin